MFNIIKRCYNRLIWVLYAVMPIFMKRWRVKCKEGKSFSLELNTAHEVHRAITFHEKEPEMIEWIDGFSGKCESSEMVFYDIGANVGIYSLYAASLYGEANIYAFEPQSTNFSSLCLNIARNNFKKLLPLQMAVSDSERIDILHVGVMAAGAGAASVGGKYLFTRRDVGFKQGICCASLNALWEKKFIKRPNFIKIDVDGHEGKILDGGDLVWSDRCLKGVVIEFEYTADSAVDELIKRMKSHGLDFVKASVWTEYSAVRKSSMRNFIFERLT